MRWPQRQRVRFIFKRLDEEDAVGRSDLFRKYGIRPAQASLDFRLVEETWPGAMAYDPSAKKYRRGPRFAEHHEAAKAGPEE